MTQDNEHITEEEDLKRIQFAIRSYARRLYMTYLISILIIVFLSWEYYQYPHWQGLLLLLFCGFCFLLVLIKSMPRQRMECEELQQAMQNATPVGIHVEKVGDFSESTGIYECEFTCENQQVHFFVKSFSSSYLTKAFEKKTEAIIYLPKEIAGWLWNSTVVDKDFLSGLAVRQVAIIRKKAVILGTIEQPEQYIREDKKGRLFHVACYAAVAFMFLFIFCVLGLRLSQAYHERSLIRQAESWPVVNAEIVRSGVEVVKVVKTIGEIERYDFSVAYRYEVNGKQYESTRPWFGYELLRNQQEAKSLVARYPIAINVNIHYQPDDPSQSVLEVRQIEEIERYIETSWLLLILIPFLCIGPAVVFWNIQQRRIHKIRNRMQKMVQQ